MVQPVALFALCVLLTIGNIPASLASDGLDASDSADLSQDSSGLAGPSSDVTRDSIQNFSRLRPRQKAIVLLSASIVVGGSSAFYLHKNSPEKRNFRRSVHFLGHDGDDLSISVEDGQRVVELIHRELKVIRSLGFVEGREDTVLSVVAEQQGFEFEAFYQNLYDIEKFADQIHSNPSRYEKNSSAFIVDENDLPVDWDSLSTKEALVLENYLQLRDVHFPPSLGARARDAAKGLGRSLIESILD